MRDLRALDEYRVRTQSVLRLYGNFGDETCGVFNVASKVAGRELHIVASSGEGWEHVSVSMAGRCPNWAEMEQVKRLFFKEDETAMQLHVPVEAHINVHPHCLHLWRPTAGDIPRPPGWMVA